MNSNARRSVALALVAAASVASFLVARGGRKPFNPSAPEWRVTGPADAKAVIVEFSDFQCPACRTAEAPLQDILKLNEGKVRFVFKHFPLERMHPHARAAAIAADCAGRQGKFWEFHHALYETQPEWYDPGVEKHLQSFAKKFKLDAAAWEACRKDPAASAAIDADVKDGDNAWVAATPTFFVNGKRFVGALQLHERGRAHLAKELAK